MRAGGFLLVAVLGAIAAGCGGGVTTRVPDDLIATLPREAAIDIFDSENQVSIALEGVDRVNRDLEANDHSVDKANAAKRAAKAAGAKSVWDARLAYLAADRKRAKLDLAFALTLVDVAKAKVEEVKAKVVERYSLSGKYNVNRFTNQVARLDGVAKKAKAKLDRAEVAAKAARSAWEKLRDGYTSKTSDFDSVAVEE